MKILIHSAIVVGMLLAFLPAATAVAPDVQFVPDQLLVQFQPGTEEWAIQAINDSISGHQARKYRLDPYLRLVKLPAGTNLDAAIAYYQAQPEVVYAERDLIYHTQLIPNDPKFGDLWGMNNTGQSGGLYDFDIDAPEAWEDHTDSPQVVIGSIDTGVDINHEDLAGNFWTNPGEIAGNGLDDDGNGYVDDVSGWDFVNNDNDPYDDNSHGTHTMGTAAAKGNNGIGVAGVTWSAQIMRVKVCNSYGSCPTSAIISGIDYATENGADVTSNSYGGGGYNQSMKDAIDRANDAGVLFVAAAGNNSSDNDANPFYPASYDSPNIISVAAMDRYGNKSSFSNYGGTTVDLGAPGSSILSTTPNNGYGTKSGTSMACPHVTGAVAFLKGYNPTLDYLQYKQIIMDSAEPNENLAGRTVTGGVLNIRNALDMTPPINVPPENDPPVADPGGPYKGQAWRPVTFDGSGSSDPDETELNDYVALYIWDFGDGSRVSTSSPTVTHIYGWGNTDYTVTLTVKDKFAVSSDPSSTVCRIRGGGRKPR